MYGIYHKGQLVIGRNGQALIYAEDVTALTMCATIVRDRKAVCYVEFIQLKVI